MRSERPRLAVALWLLVLALSAWQLARTRVVADLSAFLPPSATPTQQLLLEQMRSGAGSRIVLMALSGAPPERLAAASEALAQKLRESPLFASVQNGAAEGLRADREALLNHRYVLSPASGERLSASGLKNALQSALAELGTQPGSALRAMLPRDPTGELLRIVERLPAAGPAKRNGVWFSADGARALLVAETVAGGFDPVAQEQAVVAIRAALTDRDIKLELSGAGVFAAEGRAAVERDAWLLSLVSGTLVLLLMLRVYRRPRIVAVLFVPVASGLLIGIAAVSVTFGYVHAITLGFGATLIGEAVDYPSYACLNAARGESLRAALVRIWPTLRLAVLTTVLGGLTMLLSSFAGLAQLGLLSMSGVLVAGLVTRHIVPTLAGSAPVTERDFSMRDVLAPIRRAAPLIWVLAAVAVVALFWNRDRLWEDDLGAMSPVPEHLKLADRELRRELGAPDVRHLLVVRGESQESALARAEALEPKLDELVRRGVIRGYDLATRYLPSRAEQERRLAALPEPAALKANLDQALRGLPFRPGVFDPFLREVEESRRRGPLRPADLEGTVLGMKVKTLVLPAGAEWAVIVPLTGVGDIAALEREVPVLDLKAESERLLAGYRQEALRLSALGFAVIVLALGIGLRSARSAGQVIVPVLLALVLTAGLLHAVGARLTVFHLIAILLVMGIGLNYSLFFDRPEEDPAARGRTLFSLFMNSATTVIAFGTLAWASSPVLHSIGLTVTIGALAAFAASAALARR